MQENDFDLYFSKPLHTYKYVNQRNMNGKIMEQNLNFEGINYTSLVQVYYK